MRHLNVSNILSRSGIDIPTNIILKRLWM